MAGVRRLPEEDESGDPDRRARTGRLTVSREIAGPGELRDLGPGLLAQVLELQRVRAVRLLTKDAGAAVDAAAVGQLELQQLVDGERAVGVHAHAAGADVHRASFDPARAP